MTQTSQESVNYRTLTPITAEEVDKYATSRHKRSEYHISHGSSTISIRVTFGRDGTEVDVKLRDSIVERWNQVYGVHTMEDIFALWKLHTNEELRSVI